MTLRYCPRCRADVEDAGGFCLLGHRLPVVDEDPIADLRAEVDRAFNKVQVDISKVFEEKLDEPVPAPVGNGVEEHLDESAPASTGNVYEELRSDAEIADEVVQNRRNVWRQLGDDAPVDRDDPILSFSPSPRMEWGPDTSRRRRRERD